MIVTILGGSAGSTPGLVDWLAKQRPTDPMTIRLCGRTSDHLTAVTHASRLLAHETSIRIEAFERNAWTDALQNADVAIVQIRIGGLQGREFDEAFPLQYGIPGDEGLGPGGLSAALRNWPSVRHMLSEIQRNAPHCMPILLTSPGSLLVRLAARTFPGFPVYAICELPFTTLAEICRTTAKPINQVDFSYAGINHLGWLYGVTYEGADLIATYCERQKESCFYRVIREFGAVPMKYFRLHLELERASAERSQNGTVPSRAKQLGAIHRETMKVFREGEVEQMRMALARRPAPWYTEALGPLLVQLSQGQPDTRSRDRPYFLSIGDSDGTVSERAYRLEGKTFRALPCAEAPEPVRQLNNSYMEYEGQAALSVEEPDRTKMADALMVHPWVRRRDQALALSEALWRGFLAFEEQKESTWH